MKLTAKNIEWMENPEPHDYPAAENYLNLIFNDAEAKNIIKKLTAALIVEFKAKDIFRASKLSLLGVSNSHVKKNIKKIEKGEHLSPILLVRDPVTSTVIIADGYHRLCTVYQIDEDAVIPCQIV